MSTGALGLLRQPKTVLFGPGRRAQLPYLLEPLGSTVLVCTDERMAGSAEFAGIRDSLSAQGLDVRVFSRVEPDLPRENVEALLAEVDGGEIDVVLGVGGGSCLDFAKVASIMLRRGGNVADLYGENLVEGPGLPLVTVPTTGGTGAEVTCIAVVYDADKGMKVGVASPYLEPCAAVVDPELTLTCPPGLTAATGADALSHLVESFTGREKHPDPGHLDRHLYAGKNVLTDMYALRGFTLLNSSLERVAKDPSDLAARTDTMLGALSAGMAINTAGTAGAHAIQSPIGALTHTAHGFGVGALLPYVMRFNLPVREAEFAEIGVAFGITDPALSQTARAHAAIERMEEILGVLGVPLNLRDLGLEPDQFTYVAEQAMLATRLTANNPRDLSEAAIVEILKRGYADDRTWWEL
ncbi:iron-containing alcohol dehydrogenase [Amycolatopsis sp. NPDC051903]|uniref:iron-containing alcohol dehydrogenase n=1 Tax=Amycolatopsis sp. NPDC051903 TaxID=3363936 RepID=UPI003788ED3A